jgi:hypothetical protein
LRTVGLFYPVIQRGGEVIGHLRQQFHPSDGDNLVG